MNVFALFSLSERKFEAFPISTLKFYHQMTDNLTDIERWLSILMTIKFNDYKFMCALLITITLARWECKYNGYAEKEYE